MIALMVILVLLVAAILVTVLSGWSIVGMALVFLSGLALVAVLASWLGDWVWWILALGFIALMAVGGWGHHMQEKIWRKEYEEKTGKEDERKIRSPH